MDVPPPPKLYTPVEVERPPAPKSQDETPEHSLEKLKQSVNALKEQSEILLIQVLICEDENEKRKVQFVLDEVTAEMLQAEDQLEELQHNLATIRCVSKETGVKEPPAYYSFPDEKILSPIKVNSTRLEHSAHIYFRESLPPTAPGWIPKKWSQSYRCDLDALFLHVKGRFPLMYVFCAKNDILRGYMFLDDHGTEVGKEWVTEGLRLYAAVCTRNSSYRVIEFYRTNDALPIVTFRYDSTKGPIVYSDSKVLELNTSYSFLEKGFDRLVVDDKKTE